VYALGCLAMIAAEQGRLSEARRLIGRATGMGRGFTPKEQFAGLMASHLATAIVFDGEGDTPAALDAIEMAMLVRRGTGFVELAKALMVKAQILTHSGDPEAAEASRSQAAGVLQGRVDAALAHRLLAGIIRTDGAVSRGATADEELTSKELEVLGLLRTRMSRREIGDRLYVSLNTVKTHQRGLYRKLGVDNRAEAVSRARDLGLLQPVVCESADSLPNPTEDDRWRNLLVPSRDAAPAPTTPTNVHPLPEGLAGKDVEAIAMAVDETVATLGGVDILVDNAGVA
jgi:LuxR family transcriptional regulator, maltose regulon positive regulatory protein